MKKLSIIFSLILLTTVIMGQNLPLLKVSDNNRYIVTENNQPFFWLGGTAWELIHRLSKEEIELYLTDRAEKGFTVIQTVILAELDGLNTPNFYGEKPLINNDPTKLNINYFELVDYVIEKSNELGLYIGLLPTWGDKFNKKWGAGPEIFTPENAETYGRLLAERYIDNNNIIWILGGDRAPETQEQYEIIRAMAKGIRQVDTKHLITYHPVGAKNAVDFFNENWLDIDMFQSGHSRNTREYNYVLKSKNTNPPRPVINGEARYENIKDRFWENTDYGWLDDADVRISAYWSILAGAAGYSYGCNDIWQMYDINKNPVINARTDWKAALDLPGATQMGYMKKLFEMFPWQTLEYSPALILNNNPENDSFIVAAMDSNKDAILAYTPLGKPIQIDIAKLDTKTIYGYWFNPRSGNFIYIGQYKPDSHQIFTPWADGWGSDFLLILPGKKIHL